MLIIQDFTLGEMTQCPYLPGRESRCEYFLATDLSETELSAVLSAGYRKFGLYYFRPSCQGCRLCVPIRVNVNDFVPTKSQRRVCHKNANVEVRFSPLSYSDEIYDIYSEHSRDRFGTATDKDDFFYSFYQQSCPALQSEYYLDGRLMAVGFLDRTEDALSSVYFVYRTAFAPWSPGTFSVLREIEFARARGLSYYYLGYFVEGNTHMAYKDRFSPNEKYSWSEKKWLCPNASPYHHPELLVY